MSQVHSPVFVVVLASGTKVRRKPRKVRNPVAVTALMLAGILLLAGQASGAVKQETVRALAENVLGPGTVKSLALTEEGATVLIRWQSATYRPGNKLQTTRELLYAEAELATGSIMGRLTVVSRVRFVILLKEQAMASGENLRGKGVKLTFAAAFGGGTFKPSEPKGDASKKGGTAAAKE